jgi:hypothetical protein
MFDLLVQQAAGCRQPVLTRHGSSQSVSQSNKSRCSRGRDYCRDAPRFRSGVTLEPGGNTCHVACHPKDDEHAVAPEASRGMV